MAQDSSRQVNAMAKRLASKLATSSSVPTSRPRKAASATNLPKMPRKAR